MGIANDIKKLNAEIIASYRERAEACKQRLKANAQLAIEVQNTLKGFKKDQEEVAQNITTDAAILRADLKKSEKERLNDFRKLMTTIGTSITTIQQEVTEIQHSASDMLSAYMESRSKMSRELNEQFIKFQEERKRKNKDRENDFNEFMSNIRQEVEQSKTALRTLLESFSVNHNNMAKSLRDDLNTYQNSLALDTCNMLERFQEELNDMSLKLNEKLLHSQQSINDNEQQRLEHYQQTMQEISSKVTSIKQATAKLLKDCSQERIQMSLEWESLVQKLNEIKNGDQVVNIKPPKEQQSPKADISYKTKSSKPSTAKKVILEEKKPTPLAPKEMSLEEKIISYVAAHPEGVKVSEMEEPLGEQRMRIGYLCKKLLESGKLTRHENAYFPKLNKKKK
ncbi:hypothetical protein EMN47_17460 [Prolixibacteraceae bacterium JC049]|nr:hypothetical protein [Prolixibacteraceae bacterium JC049]